MSARPRASLTLRVSLLFAAASTAVLLALGQFIARSVDAHFVDIDREIAAGKLVLAGSVLAQLRERSELETLDARFAAILVGHHDIALRVAAADGRVLYANAAGAALTAQALTPAAPAPGAQPWPGAAPHRHPHPTGHHHAGAGESLPIAWSHDGRTWRGLVGALPSGLPGEPPMTVVVGVDTAHHDHYLDSLRRAVWSFVASAMLAMGLLGWVAARRGLAPLRRVGRAADTVTAARLDRRLPVDDLPAEVAELAAQLNAMLARLEAAFERLSALSADLAHELRTPVAGLITQTQVALARERDAAGYREALVANAEALDRLARMIGDLLLLARSDAGLDAPRREPLSLRDEALRVVAFHEALAADHGLTIRVDGDARVAADRGLIDRALANLLSNAIRHAIPGSVVEVAIGAPAPAEPATPAPAGGTPGAGAAAGGPDAAGGRVRVVVRNAGEAVPAEVLARMFDRFFRADAARARDPDGSGLGLGLAIVRSIARAHGGESGAAHRAGVTEVWIELPAGAAAVRERGEPAA